MSSHTREGSRDRELVLSRHQTVPMWDSSDPERAPPPLPMNPGSSSPITKGNVSPGIQAVAANFTEKARENAPSPYTTNPMPPKSPEKSLIKGQFHKRMQSLQNTDTRSEFLNYLESRSPERPLRAATLDQSPKLQEKALTKSGGSPEPQDSDQDLPNLLISNRYLSRPILGESTPTSATMLALQTMQLPPESEPQSRARESEPEPFSELKHVQPHSFESLSSQILSLTDIASSLQREMAQLSRRSKDNATDLVSLKAATNARDEDIRKSLRDLSSNLASKFLDGDAATRFDFSALLGSETGINNKESDSSPSSKKSYSAPRMQSPSPFLAAMEREFCGSPGPITDGSASIALLEKVLREMATKEGQEKLLELMNELKARPAPDNSINNVDATTTKMLEEILNIVKQDWGNKALVRSRAGGVNAELNGSDQAYAPDMDIIQGNQARAVEHAAVQSVTEEMLDIMKRVRNSVIEGGGMTNEVKALVRELRGEVLGMGRNLARQFEEAESSRAIEDKPTPPPGEEEIARIVDDSLEELRGQLASIMNDNKRHSTALSEFRAAVDGAEIYSIVKKALDNFNMSQVRDDEPDGARMQKEDILEAVREAWETYKPEIELQNFGLEREEILECLSEGLQAYQPQHDQAVTYDQVLAAVQAGLQQFEQPPTISKTEIIQTIQECLESSQPRSSDLEQLAAIREEILQAVTESVTSQSALTRDTFDSGLGRDEILSAVSDGIEAHFLAAKEMEHQQITKEDVANVVNDAFVAQQSALTPHVQPPISREEILAAITEGLEGQNSIPREIELNREDLMEAITAGLNEATTGTNQNVGEQILERLHEELEGVKEELRQNASLSEKDTEQVLNTIKDNIALVRSEVEGYAVNATEASGKHEIMDTVKEGFRLLQADLEKTITDVALTNRSQGNPDTPELLDAMEKEFEHLRQTLSSLLIRNNVSDEKDEILDAIRDISESQKSTSEDSISKVIQQEFESIRDSLSMSLVPVVPQSEGSDQSDKSDIIAALRESLEAFHAEHNQPKDGSESLLSVTGELTGAFQDGVGIIREDLAKILERPVELDTSELLETLKEGLGSLKAEVEMLRQSQAEVEESSIPTGGELMLASEANTTTSGDIEVLKSLISQLQVKVEAIEAAPRAADLPEDIVKKEHLDEVLLGLHELQSSVSAIVARENPADETTAKKEDTDAIETLLRNTKSQLDEMAFPAAHEIARAEHLSSLEELVKETKDVVTELYGRLEAECPTKAEIGTLETLMKDMWFALDESKGKDKEGEEEAGEETESDTEKLLKSDLQTVEAMIFEVKTQVEELKLPDADALPTKSEIADLAALVTEFREKVEAENELTGQGFEARKIEHAGIAEKVDEVRSVVEGLGEELKSKLDGSHEGLTELRQLLEGLATSAESFTTAENVNELTELINREFERARGEQDETKLEKEERDAAIIVKHDETRAAITVELGEKIDEKLGEVMAKYDAAQSLLDVNFSKAEERHNENLEVVTTTKALAEDIKLVIGSMGNSVNEACERMSDDAKTFFEKVDVSYTKMEEMHSEVKIQQEQARSDAERAAAATERVETKLHEFHPQVLESIQEILSIVGQHYNHSQKATEDLKMDLSILPTTIPQMLPALPAPEPEKYDDSQLHEKLNNLLDHTKSTQVQDALNVLTERVTNNQVHEKLDQLLSQTTSTNAEVYEKLNELLGHTADTKGPIHDKLDTLIDHATNTDQSVTQMMKLDEMHKDIMETSRKMNEMLAAQSAIVAEDTARRQREAEEAAIALERRTAQREQVEAEILTLGEEKDSLLAMIQKLKTEKDDLAAQNAKLNKEVSGLEMALELRHEEMQLMEERADSLEKRILEGVLDHARTVLLSRPNSMQGLNMKKVRHARGRGTSASSTASTAKDTRSILGSSVGLALKKRAPPTSQTNSTVTANTKERRILSLSHVTGNRGVSDRQPGATGGFTNLKRSQSVKSNFSYRKASWGGRSSVANKENEAFPEEDGNPSGDESETGTERRTSYAGTYADSMTYGPGSVVSVDRQVSTASTTTGRVVTNPQSVVDDGGADKEELKEGGNGGDGESDVEDATQATNENDFDDSMLGEESAKMVLYRPHDSGLGTEITSKGD
ncbi:hypothetical protein P175DRAFT_0505239 [Aspergillus ochraceoroseus IBT 24754]|uniref:Chromosome segregation ATPase family protein n=3 Tax=Aspergillus subgen. Nidulantes TaxID=2720870 RepID=A0A0F8X1R7_9EURO|nr:uncharacterized protein P175DRAFT_0505239 [Aspergillus ochraceoroseus IBT 24754]KKK17507.1 hypothetical protein ARAM_002516 [Aspergillus rambellii]KKK20806.1 hypothetical protein AOCH_006735 [Aspergillus ochraceoroseus]PTU17089.1 hypothetical protein P175DRAFT_0505239 [Aspergillus ochraceoroseus IBT 24754]